jgi:hypothetical protein
MKSQTLRYSKILAVALFATALWSSCKKDDKAKVTPPAVAIRPTTSSSSAYVTQLFEFNPAPGQFINTGLGDTVAATGTLNGINGLVSLGAWGGYIIVGFDHTVVNVTGKNNIVVYGNGFPGFAEPGVIWVMQDTNGNGKPDDTWYEIDGSASGLPGYIRNYSVTYTRPACDTCSVPWSDNQGHTGVVQTNIFHTQAYFPIGIKGNTYTLKGTLLPSTKIDMSNPSYITSGAFDYGYSDSHTGGDTVSIEHAIDATGKRVKLTGVDFIKVQTGIQFNMGWLGEQSTEFCGAADVSLLKK